MQNEEVLNSLNYIKKQFLQNISVKEISWKQLPKLDLELQEQIIVNTTQLNIVRKHPINIDYQKAFLKNLLQYLEKQGSVIYDGLYEEYGRLVALPALNQEYFKHYFTKSDNIILKENIHLISEGTTGLRTWEASLALSEWIPSNTSIFKNKAVLELGSGIGLTGLVIALHCSVKNLYLTDCHPSVLQTLCENININIGITTEKNSRCEESCLLKKQTDSCTLSVLNLPWEDISLEYCQKLGHIDLLVAADVVYDRSIFNPLVEAVNNLFRYSNVSQFILSCTERNLDTLQDFLLLLNKNYQIDSVKVPAQENFLWASHPPVRIYSLKLKKDV